jgi:hypothetical protein
MRTKKELLRRCHVCGGVTTLRQCSHVDRCEGCGKHFARFFYFNDEFTPTQGEGTLRPPLTNAEFRPIVGLTAFWDGPDASGFR